MQEGQPEKRPSKWFVLVLAATFVAALAGLLWSYSLAGRLTHAEAQLAATQKQNEQLAAALNDTNAKLRVTRQTLGHRLGATQRELRRRASELLHRQRATAKKLEQEEAEEAQENAEPTAGKAASSNVPEGRSSQAGGGQAGAPPAEGQSEGALTPMRRVTGDLGIESGQIATNAGELKALEQTGERSYYPFTLRRGKKQVVATVTLELRRVNGKRKRYTLTVFADHKKIEKKNRTLDEPVQFYAGQPRVLFELVVNQIGHDEVQGYLAAPKSGSGTAVSGQ